MLNTYKCKGLEIYVINCPTSDWAAFFLIQNKIGVLPENLEEFWGEIPPESRVIDLFTGELENIDPEEWDDI